MALNPQIRRRALALSMALLGLCAASSQAHGDCGVPVGLHQELQFGQLVLMGEMHGTKESPQAFGAAVCHALEHGREVSVGLELNPDQAVPLAHFLASDGGAAAAERLRQTTFWSGPLQDGRSSLAMFALIERLRQWKQRYPALAVFVLDGMPGAAGASRDEQMARRVRAERAQRPQGIVLTLTGNAHNRLKPLAFAMQGRAIPAPMGVWLADLSPAAVELATAGGSAWICTPACGVHVLEAGQEAANEMTPVYQLLPAAAPYTGQWSLGVSTASLPARGALASHASTSALPH